MTDIYYQIEKHLEEVAESKKTTEDRVRELIEWAEQQPPETFED